MWVLKNISDNLRVYLRWLSRIKLSQARKNCAPIILFKVHDNANLFHGSIKYHYNWTNPKYSQSQNRPLGIYNNNKAPKKYNEERDTYLLITPKGIHSFQLSLSLSKNLPVTGISEKEYISELGLGFFSLQ